MVRFSTEICKSNKRQIIAFLLIFLVTFSFSLFFIRGREAFAHSNQSSYVVIEQSSNRILKGNNVDLRLPMASTTKIMTALIVLENAKLDDVVTIPKEAVGVEGSSIYLKSGEKISVKDLLYGLMLRSGNDSAVALAIHTAGNVNKFVELMNKKATDLGLKNTSFKNPHGLSAKDHYTSAYDLAIIASEAMNNNVFKEIVGSKTHSVVTQNEEENRYFANKNRILYSYSGGNGIKTGYTKEAGRCLVASSMRDDMQVIAVALNHYNYFDLCTNLMNYAHDNFKMTKVLDKNTSYKEVSVKKGKKVKSTMLYPKNDLFYPLKKDGSENLKVEIIAPNTITAPHNKETSCGIVKIYLDNCLKFEEKLYTIYSIEKKFSITDIWS